MDKVSNSTNSSAQVYANQNSSQVQQTNHNQANETNRTESSADACKQNDTSSINVFRDEEETNVYIDDYGQEISEDVFENKTANGIAGTPEDIRAYEPNTADAIYSELKDEAYSQRSSILSDDLDFAKASPDDIASAVENYAVSKGYNVPEGFGRELVASCSANNIDYGLALAICEANQFGSCNGSLMGFESLTSPNGEEVTWQEDLHNSVALLAELRQNSVSPDGEPFARINGDPAEESVMTQLSVIASQLGDQEWASNVYNIYGTEVSPSLSDIDGVQSGYFSRVQKTMDGQKGCKQLKNGSTPNTLYQKMALDEFGDIDRKYDAQTAVHSRIDQVRERYSGADAACMCALELMDIGADYGVRLKYQETSTPDHLANEIDPGIKSDCCNFVSWLLDQGTEMDINAMNVKGLGHQGKNGIKIPNSTDLWKAEHGSFKSGTKAYETIYAPMKPGDVVTDKTSDHAMMAIYNDPESQTMILAESTDDGGVQLREVTYKKAFNKLKYSFVDATDVYNGTAEGCFSVTQGCYQK